jgi:hypothetical protein
MDGTGSVTRYFCTYFDHRYLSMGIALYYSLKKHCPDFRLWILCLSPECYNTLNQKSLDNVYLLRLENIEKGDEELLKAKQNRSLLEYYFTLTPSLLLYLLKLNEVELITYLDADLYFFSNPEGIFEEIGTNSIAIIPHRSPPRLKHKEMLYGTYNVGWLSFRRDKNGMDCLQWYRERCNEWCFTRVEEDKFADQKYLDKFEQLFENVYVIQHKGANLAVWNIENYRITTKNDEIYVDEQPLVFFHFHRLKRVSPFLWDSGFADYGTKFSRIVRKNIYLPYIKTLKQIEYELTETNTNATGAPEKQSMRHNRIHNLASKLFRLKPSRELLRTIYTNSFVFTYDRRDFKRMFG